MQSITLQTKYFNVHSYMAAQGMPAANLFNCVIDLLLVSLTVRCKALHQVVEKVQALDNERL